MKVKNSLLYFSDHNNSKTNLRSRMHTYQIIMRIFFIMDVPWGVRLIFVYLGWATLERICRYIDYSLGIIIFVLFILKRSTIRFLMESIRNR
ncbi:G-protein coupled receptor Mth-like [Drosophila kikkawai]|uniref:G-protein coupled receptor Mth-like n=1 Tax=Drosophila kikkawai TaxID=30033 RepID=A0ABM4GLT3_DROKI